MANTIVNVTKFAKEIQMYLRASTPAIGVSNTRYKAALEQGQKFDAPYASGVRVDDYNYSTDATIRSMTMTSDQLEITESKIATANYDPLQNKLTLSEDWQDDLASEIAYQLSRNINQFAAQTGVDGATQTVAGGTLNVGSVFSYLTSIKTQLSRNRAGAGQYFGLVEPGLVDLLSQADVANGFQRADAALRQGYVGDTNAGFRIYECVDLPCSVSFTLANNPSDGDTVEVYGIVFTFKNTAATPGQVDIGGSAAATQANLRAAINGTGTGDGTDYFELTVEDRDELSNAQVLCGAFSSDVATITSYGRIGGVAVGLTAGDGFGDETCEQLFGMMGALDLVVQEAPEIDERKEPKNKSINMLGTTQFGSHVYHRNTKRLIKGTFTV